MRLESDKAYVGGLLASIQEALDTCVSEYDVISSTEEYDNLS